MYQEDDSWWDDVFLKAFFVFQRWCVLLEEVYLSRGEESFVFGKHQYMELNMRQKHFEINGALDSWVFLDNKKNQELCIIPWNYTTCLCIIFIILNLIIFKAQGEAFYLFEFGFVQAIEFSLPGKHCKLILLEWIHSFQKMAMKTVLYNSFYIKLCVLHEEIVYLLVLSFEAWIWNFGKAKNLTFNNKKNTKVKSELLKLICIHVLYQGFDLRKFPNNSKKTHLLPQNALLGLIGQTKRSE